MQVTARRRDVAVTERLLDPGQAGAPLDGMRAVGVAQPVGRYGFVDACALGRRFHHLIDSTLSEPAAIALGEHRIVGAGVAAQR